MANLSVRRQQGVEQCLVWAERQGYWLSRTVCRDYAADKGLGIGIYDLGSYGEEIEFFDTPEAAAKAQEPGITYNLHKPLTGVPE